MNDLATIPVTAQASHATHFDGVSIGLHWATVILVAAMFASAWSIGLARDAAAAQGLPAVHRSVGVTLWVLAIVRLSRRLHTVNLFVWPAGGRLLSATRVVRRDGYSLVEWTQGGLRFAAVSDIDPGELQQFKAAYVAHSPDTPH
jgi:hypothetical protein